MLSITKDQNIRYALFLHDPVYDGEGLHYCRAMNECVDDGFAFCACCPLCVRGEGEPGALCWYYDILAGYSHGMEPMLQKKRIDGLIAADFTGEFPEYLAGSVANAKRQVEERAIIYAARAHKGSFRKGSGLPYIVHPMEVMMICAGMTDDSDVIAAAALHDVLEDTPMTSSELEREFGTRIAALVSLESENKREGQPKGDTWKIRKQENLERERTAPIEAKMIMLADKISNMRSTVRDFRKGGADIWSKFNMKDPAEQEWYYRSVAEVLSELSHTPEYGEYTDMLEEVFG